MSKPISAPVNDDYEEFLPDWKIARDVVGGEKLVKAAGTEYLPRLDDMTTSEYEAYKSRSKFFNATGRTKAGLLGMLFRRDPKLVLKGTELETIGADIDMEGNPVRQFAKETADEVLTVGRGGIFVDYNENERRPYVAFYEAESILDWEVTRRFGNMVLSRLVLHECVDDETTQAEYDPNVAQEESEVEQLRVIELEGDTPETTQCVTQLWRLTVTTGNKPSTIWDKFGEPIVQLRRGEALKFIPFVFANADGPDECCCKPPLADIIAVNLHHYRVSADYNHALFFAATPTAWVAGFPKESKLRIGSSVAWVTEMTDAKAGYLEFTGQGLEPIRQALEDDKKDMAILGARLLEEQKRDTEAAETVRMRQTGETSVLSDIADSVSKSVTRALKMVAWWIGSEAMPEDVPDETASFALTKDFVESRMSPAELTALTSTWLRGGISQDTYLDNLRKGEILSDGVTNDDERSRIEDGIPILTDLMQAQRPPQQGAA